ncbi:hypothetical protein I9W82_001075 [Candida metapsilosis]|uniref:PXA domain-containing protein n=1 Tax=Candida metapsilosis TaxID=273372 RepID=A0A8H7ZLM3_9ASCO|nr:hypothetical protein I9W82_001075 [Candida metapsilosis]
MDRYQDKIKPKPRPVSAIISTTTTNVTSHDHGTLFSPSSSTSLKSMTSQQTPQATPVPTNHLHSRTKSDQSKGLQKPRISLERALKKPSIQITKKDILKNELRTNNIDKTEHNRAEVQFLVSIYSPGLRPLRNASLMERLKSRLPIMVNNYDVNLSLHMFLSTIMVKFVNSWYLTKLNTGNLEFPKSVYNDILVALVQDAAKRIESTTSCNMLHIVDGLISILNTHLETFVGEGKFPYKVLDEYYNLTETENSLFYDVSKDPKDILQMYFSQRHVIFDQPDDAKEDQVLLYFRVMVKSILEKVMANNTKDSIFTSKIVSDLLILTLGDFVLNQLFQKLSQPAFLLGLINKAVVHLLLAMKEREKRKALEEVSKQSFISTIVAFVCTIYTQAAMLASAIKLSSGYEAPFDVINSSLFSLVGTLLTLKQIRPLLYNLFISTRTMMLGISGLKNGINNVASNYAIEHLNKAITAESVDKLINRLRTDLFYSEDKNVSREEQSASLDIVVGNLVELFQYIPMGKRINPSILRNKIKRVLIIFDQDEQLDPTNKINQYLIIQLLDRIVYAVYNDI